MPNTLAHIGIQALITRGIVRQADPGWILAGCVLPDMPWILQRALRALPLDISLYDLRLYAVVQSSLALSLVAAAALACLSARPLRTGAVLGLGCLLHLLLDATQTKWANGVVLFAPIDWRVINFGLYWPEDWPSLLLTGFGLIWIIRAFLHYRPWSGQGSMTRVSPMRRVCATAGLVLYVLLPLPLMPHALRADPHFIATLQNTGDRPGRMAGFDRSALTVGSEGMAVLRPWTREQLPLASNELARVAGTVSVTGRFTPEGAFMVQRVHIHPEGRRDAFSYIGLLAIALWVIAAFYAHRNRP